MKTSALFTGLLGSLLLFSCTSSENKSNNAIKADTAIIEKASENLIKDSVVSQQNTADENTINLVKQTLTTVFKDDLSKNLIEEPGRKFKFFEYDLNNDQEKEIFVGLTGPYFCGSGGCTILLLSPKGELITKFTVTAYPISIAGSNTSGWKNLILNSNGADHLVKFDGKKYPSNPSVQPVYVASSAENLVKGLYASDQSYSW